jgi:hypothetical protein
MSRGPCTFKQRDVTQALKAAAAAGMKVARYEIDREGTIVVVAAGDDRAVLRNDKLKGWSDVHEA